MDNRKILARIERRLEAVKKTAEAASKEAGKSPDAIRNLRRAVREGRRTGANAATLAALAPVLRTSISWLMDESGPESIDSEQMAVKVWGKAGAGGRVFHFHNDGAPIGDLILPDWIKPGLHTAAIEIEGDSLGATYNGWFAIYDEVRDPPTRDLIGQPCVVETMDGHVYIKSLAKGRGRRFTLTSDFAPPLYDVELRWAAKVKAMVPP